MGYELGIDVGTTTTAAAAHHDDGTVSVLPLGALADSIPTVVHLQDDGTMVVGEAAARRGAVDVAGTAREFKRRLGDPTPLILRTSPFSADVLVGRVIEYVVDRVTERLGEPPRAVALTHPANWSAYKVDLFHQAVQVGGLTGARVLTEPEAAAMAYTAQSRVPEGAAVAVYDLGGGTFDAVVLRRTGDRFERLGHAVGIERLGGIDFDEAVFELVRRRVGDRWPADPDDPSLPAPMQQLRRSCTEAKELLSDDLEAIVPVVLPGVSQTEVVTRGELEAMIAGRIEETVDALDAAIASAGLEPGQLQAVVAVGGSSRIPLVRRRLTEQYGALASADIEPTFAVARGAALAAAVSAHPAAGAPPAGGDVPPVGPAGPPPTSAPPVTTSPGAPLGDPVAEPVAPAAVGVAATASPATPPPSAVGPPTTTPGRPDPAQLVWGALAALFAVMALAGPYKMLRDEDGGDEPVVAMAGLTFAPASLVVPRGTAVLFDNDDVAPHTVTSDDGTVDSGTLRPGATFSLVVNERFSYFCAIHPSMSATIEIEA